MKNNIQMHLDTLISRYPELSACADDIKRVYEIISHSFSNGGKLLIAGNGGSCADAQHIVGELMKSFVLARRVPEKLRSALIKTDDERGKILAEKLQGALPAMALCDGQSLNTAFTNDVEGGGTLTFAQQVYGYGKEGDVFMGITTSGNSENVLFAAVTAKAAGLKVVALTGEGGGKIASLCDGIIKVPCHETYKIQELHLPVYHALCLMLEENFFGTL